MTNIYSGIGFERKSIILQRKTIVHSNLKEHVRTILCIVITMQPFVYVRA